MGKMFFGKDETLVCLRDVDFKASDGAQLCLGHKFTKTFFVAGLYLKDDGYVLKVRSSDTYYPLDDAKVRALQAEGAIPTPLPAYSIPLIEYAFGYSLWLIIA